MTQQLAQRNGVAQSLEQVLINGDLSQLTPEMRISYYNTVCDSLGLNKATRPFEYLLLGRGGDQKLVLYARKDCTEQLRKLHGVSITSLETTRVGDLFMAYAHARDATGREDTDMGAVPVAKPGGSWEGGEGNRRFKADGTTIELSGDELANAMLKAVTKAKRRVTLSICGLGVLDESEIEAIPGARTVTDDRKITPPSVNVQASERTHRQPEAPSSPPARTYEEVFEDQTDAPSPKSGPDRGAGRRAAGGDAAVDTAGAGGVAGGGDPPALPDLTAALRPAEGGGEEFSCLDCHQTFAAVRTRDGVKPARLWLEFAAEQGLQRALCPSCASAARRAAKVA